MGVQTVKVTKSGNSKTLPVPARMARAAGLDVGTVCIIEAVPGGFIYRVDDGEAAMRGTGTGRHGVVPEGRAVGIPMRSSVAPLDDWDF